MFPAPLEVDRYLYLKIFKEVGVYVSSFRPLSRLIGVYTLALEVALERAYSVSGPSRGR